MDRQHGVPLLLPSASGGAQPLQPVSQLGGGDAVSEAFIQALVHEHPTCLPIAEIDAMFADPVPICTELRTFAGPIDNFMVTPSGLPVLVECKLWRNPEARREVVSQILDYAKELSRWSSSDLQREVCRCLKSDGNPLLDLVRAVDPEIDEQAFHDALTANLRRGRFLLLIVGDGIREGVEAIAEYLQLHAGLHFSLGLVELPMYALPNGDRLIAPRVLARTTLITRNVVKVPDGHMVEPEDISQEPPEPEVFWKEFIDNYLKLSDPEQAKPKPSRQGYISLSLPGGTWLTVYRTSRPAHVGVYPSSWRNTPGMRTIQALVDDWDAIKDELGGAVRPFKIAGGTQDSFIDWLEVASLDQADDRKKAFTWLAERVDTFVNVLRPRMRSLVADYQATRTGPSTSGAC